MLVLFLDLYFDGGTIKVVDDNLDTYCIDGRRNTNTKGMIYIGYPLFDNSNLAPNQEKIQEEIKDGIFRFIIDNPKWVHWKPGMNDMFKNKNR